MKVCLFCFSLVLSFSPSSLNAAAFDVIIRNGTIYDGSGNEPYTADLGITSQHIAAIGNLKNDTGQTELIAKGMAVSPGFINMLSWADESLIARWPLAKRYATRRNAGNFRRRQFDGAAEPTR